MSQESCDLRVKKAHDEILAVMKKYGVDLVFDPCRDIDIIASDNCDGEYHESLIEVYCNGRS